MNNIILKILVEGAALSLWSEQGTPHAEIVARIAERTDEECLNACTVFFQLGFLDRGAGLAIAKHAEIVRSTKLVLGKVEAKIRSAFEAANVPDIPALLELHALVVEAYVRVSNKAFPAPGRN